MDICLFARPDLAPNGDFASYLEVACLADRASIHSICFGEHLVVGANTSRYPYGPWGHSVDTGWMDPMTTLAAVAAVTETIRLSTAVLLAPLRPGLLLAKEVATLDVISAGRVELGVGTGWQQEEYAGVGVSWSNRQSRFDEVIETCRTAWGEQPFSVLVDGQFLNGLWALPVPVQVRIPMFYGVKATPANAARISRLGDGWSPVGVGPEQVREGASLLRAAFDAVDRDPATLVIRIPLVPVLDGFGRIDAKETFAPAEAYLEAGATRFVVGFNHRLSSLAEAADVIDGYAEASARLQ